MEITFTRGSERTYATSVLRDDGVTLQVPSYDRTSLLPHDLAHYIVERELDLRHGFWGSIAAGALFPGMRVVSGRRPPHGAARSQTVIREAGQQGTEAEVLVGVFLGILHDDLEDKEPVAQARVNAAWKPRRPLRGPISAEEVRTVCQALRDVQKHWQALPVGQNLTVAWPHDKRSKR